MTIFLKPVSIIKKHSRDLLLIAVLFTLGQGLMLFNDGLYVDDWFIYDAKDTNVMKMFMDFGAPLRGLISILINKSLLFCHLITFVSYLIMAWLLFYILTTIKEIAAIDRLVIVLIFSLFPVNFAKVTLLVMPYTVCVLLFFGASYFLLRYIYEKKLIYHILSLFLFFISFQIESLLVFFSVPFMLIVYHERMHIGLPRSLAKLRKYIPFILLPFAYWIMKCIWFVPSGVFAGHNTIQLAGVVMSPFHAIVAAYNNLILPILASWDNRYKAGWAYYIVVIPVCLYLYNRLKYMIMFSDRNDLKFFGLGWFFYFIAVFPYLAIRVLGFAYGIGWNSRDQLLVPLGAAFILLYGVKIIFKEFKVNQNIAVLCLSLLIAGFVVSNAINCLVFERAWFKQLSVMEAVRKNDIIRNNTTFVVKDETKYVNALNEPYRFYEYTGMMKYVFGDEKRFAYDIDGGEKIERHKKEPALYPAFHIKDYISKKIEYVITIRPGEVMAIKPGVDGLSLQRTLKILFFKWFDKNKFRMYIDNIVTIECTPFDDSMFSGPNIRSSLNR